jgi:hypothetical protein
VPGNTPVGSAGTYTPIIYFRRYSQDNSGNFIMNGNQPYEDEYISTWTARKKRLNSVSWPTLPLAATALRPVVRRPMPAPACPADKVIAADIASVSTRYFSRTGNLIDHNSITDPDTGEYIGPILPPWKY